MTLLGAVVLALGFLLLDEPLGAILALFGGFWALETIFPAPAWLAEAKPRGRCESCPFQERRESCGDCE